MGINLPLEWEVPLKIAALLLAIIGHEIMHGLAALYYGDHTAKNAGRLSPNPILHIDLFGSIIIPGLLFLSNAPFLFGWAKPVPVDISRVIDRGGYFGAVVVSLAGIAYNAALAVLFTLLLFGLNGGIFSGVWEWFSSEESAKFALLASVYFCLQCIIFNVVLAVFNALPLPKFDGANALGFAGLIFGNSAIIRAYDRAHPLLGMGLLIIILATPAKIILLAPVQAILNLLLG